MSELTVTSNTSGAGGLLVHLEASQALSKSSLIPAHYQGRPENIALVLDLAHRWGNVPLMTLLHGITVVQGRPCIAATLAIALANRELEEKIWFEDKGEGSTLEVTAHATLKNGRKVSERMTLAAAVAAGWATRNPLYKSIPRQLLAYRAATFLIRRNCPEILLGLQTNDEIADVHPKKAVVVEETDANKFGKGQRP